MLGQPFLLRHRKQLHKRFQHLLRVSCLVSGGAGSLTLVWDTPACSISALLHGVSQQHIDDVGGWYLYRSRSTCI